MNLTERFRLADAWLAGMGAADSVNHAFAQCGRYPTHAEVDQALALWQDLDRRYRVVIAECQPEVKGH